MKHGNRVLSAVVLGAVAALMISSTVYQARADDIPVPPASGTSGTDAGQGGTDDTGTGDTGNTNGTGGTGAAMGYAGAETPEVSRLLVKSLGTFNYEAGKNGSDILIASSDLKDLESATKALSNQLLLLGDVTKIADDMAKSDVELKYATLDQSIKDNAAGNEEALNTFKSEVNGNFTTVNNTITSNFETVNNTITSNVAAINDAIATNKDEAKSYTDDEITKVNNTIDGNRTSADERMQGLDERITTNTSNIATVDSRIEKVVGELDTVKYEYVNTPGNPTITFSPSSNHGTSATSGP